MHKSYQALSVILVALTFFTTGVAAQEWSNWDIANQASPTSFTKVSGGADAIMVLKLTDPDEPINEGNLTSGSYFRYNYNGSQYDMNYLGEGFWYANYTVNSTGGSVLYEAKGETSSSLLADANKEANNSVTMDVGNLSAELETSIPDKVKAGKQYLIEVNVTDLWNNINEDNADVDLTFTNGSWSKTYQIDNYDGTYYYNSKVYIPDGTNSTYVVHVHATASGQGYTDAHGLYSRTVKTHPAVEGQVKYLNATEGCNNQSFFNECEWGAPVETTFEITKSEAENVNLTVLAGNKTSNQFENVSRIKMDKSGDLFTASFDFPDLNTTEYNKTVLLKYNATNGAREDVMFRQVDLKTYQPDVWTPKKVNQGSSVDIELTFTKAFTPETLNDTRMNNATIEITGPSNNQLTWFALADMTYNSNLGQYEKTVNIPADAELGNYNLAGTAENLYGEQKTFNTAFKVEDISKTFDVNDTTVNVDKTGNYSYNLSIENLLTSDNTLDIDIGGALDEEIDFGSNSVTLSPGVNQVAYNLSIQRVEDVQGEIKFIDWDANYNHTMDYTLEAPSCTMRNGSICITGHEGGWLNVTSSEKGYVSKILNFRHLGPKEGNTSYTVNIVGMEKLDAAPSAFTLNRTDDARSILLNYTVNAPGNFTGLVQIESENDDKVSFRTKLEANVTPSDKGMTAESVDLGKIKSGTSKTVNVLLENTGKVKIDSITASSSDYDVTLDDAPVLEPGDKKNATVTLDSVKSETGDITFSGQTTAGEVTATSSVTVSFVPDYEQKVEDLRSSIERLRFNDLSSAEKSKLNNVEIILDTVKTEYQKGNYEAAKENFEEAQTMIEEVETSVNSPDTNETSSPDQTPSQPSQQEEGTTPLIPIAVGLFILLIIGFVAYTSIIPEEGDPLYNVLRQ